MWIFLIPVIFGAFITIIWHFTCGEGSQKNKCSKQNNAQIVAKKNMNTYQDFADLICDDPSSIKFYRYMSSPIKNKHFACLEKEIELYKKVCQTGDCNGDAARELINVCNDDISIATDFYNLCMACDEPVPNYAAFKYLAMLFEKRGEYRAAISVCEVAIAKGYSDDGTKGGMYGRIERLKKKINKAV